MPEQSCGAIQGRRATWADLTRPVWRWIATGACCMVLAFHLVSTAQETRPGADRSSHGCQGSAGYTWSVVRGSCIRLFEVGLAFAPEPLPVNGAVHLAYVVFGPPVGNVIKRAEVFIPGEDRPIPLQIQQNLEGDTRPTLLINTAKKVRVFRSRDDHILEFRAVRYRRTSPLDDPLFQLR